MKEWPANHIVAAISIGSAILFGAVWMNTEFSKLQIGSAISSLLAIIAAWLAVVQFRREHKINVEINVLEADDAKDSDRGILMQAARRNRAGRMRKLQKQRLIQVVWIIMLLVTSELINIFSLAIYALLGA